MPDSVVVTNGKSFCQKYNTQEVINSPRATNPEENKNAVHVTFITPKRDGADTDKFSGRAFTVCGTEGKDTYILSPEKDSPYRFGTPEPIDHDDDGNTPKILRVPVLYQPAESDAHVKDAYLDFGPDVDHVMVARSPDEKLLQDAKPDYYNADGTGVTLNAIQAWIPFSYGKKVENPLLGTQQNPAVLVHSRTADGVIKSADFKTRPDMLKLLLLAEKNQQNSKDAAGILIKPDQARINNKEKAE